MNSVVYRRVEEGMPELGYIDACVCVCGCMCAWTGVVK